MKKTLIAICCLFSVFDLKAQQTLFINEIMASNVSYQMDDFFEYDDWIEIYNSGGVVNLAGYYLSDTPGNLMKYQIPATNPGLTFLTPGAHKIFWVDKDAIQGENHTNFSLSGSGESVILTMPDGVTVVDSITFGQQGDNVSYGRSCDGCPDWVFFDTPTFAAVNSQVVQPTELLYINEVQTVNTSTIHDLQWEYDQWVEIFNPNPYQVNLANYSFTVGTNVWTIANNNPYRTIIPAQGFGIYWFDGDTQDDTNHSPFLLPISNSSVLLKGPDGAVVDTYPYTSISANTSLGRSSDGAPSSIVFNVPTPRVSNSSTFIAPDMVVINEVLPANQTDTLDNAGQLEDWFEFYNPLNHAVNLGGYYVTDDPDNPQKWRIPVDFVDSVTIASHDWILFWADDDASQGVRHATFKFSNNGEYCGLYGSDGFSLVDEIRWNHINPDTSYGRVTDGAAQWVQFWNTTPEYSNAQGSVGVLESEKASLHVYPNPAHDRLFFSAIINATVYDIAGNKLEYLNRVQSVDVSSWTSGVYLIRDDLGNTYRIIKN